MTPRGGNPYVVGQWVRGERFYGRRAQLDAILQGRADRVWVVGTRRAGKTSLLKQLEVEAGRVGSGFVPVFWDFQGADTAQELALTFHDGLLDAEDGLAESGVAVERVAGPLDAALAEVVAAVSRSGRNLLLLCDEVEELIGLAEADAGCVAALGSALGAAPGVRVVLCSSPRLAGLRATAAGEALLTTFSAPSYLDRLTDPDARALIRQDKLPADQRPTIDDATVEAIRGRCGNHPYLMQLLSRRTLELGGVERAAEVVAGDRMVSHFIAVDLEMLDDDDRRALAAVAAAGTAGHAARELAAGAHLARIERLDSLGLLRRTPEGVEVANDFLRDYLLQVRS